MSWFLIFCWRGLFGEFEVAAFDGGFHGHGDIEVIDGLVDVFGGFRSPTEGGDDEGADAAEAEDGGGGDGDDSAGAFVVCGGC